jgi:hypothetical protein
VSPFGFVNLSAILVVDALGLELSYRITPGIWHAAIMADMDWK